jgi:hypothetical protein
LQAAMTDAETATPVLRSISMIIPQTPMLSYLKHLTTGTFPFILGAQAEMKLTDAVTGSQPYVRPMGRGKQDNPVEFGAKLSASLTSEGLAHMDHLRWDIFHKGLDLTAQVEAYRDRYGRMLRKCE